MLELYKERNNALISKIMKLSMPNHHTYSMSWREIISHAVENEAPGYFITFDTAIKGLRQYRQGRLPPHLNPLKRQMWAEICSKVDKVKRSLSIKTESDALAIVLAGNKASRFFISVNYATRLLQSQNYGKKTIDSISLNSNNRNSLQRA